MSLNVVVMDFVEAARLRGEGIGWITIREVLPNIMPPLVAEFGLRFCFVFLTIAALSFLGLGIQPPDRRLGQHGTRQCDIDYLRRRHAAVARGGDRAVDGGCQFCRRLVSAQDEWLAR